jgi:hypothetical protein
MPQIMEMEILNLARLEGACESPSNIRSIEGGSCLAGRFSCDWAKPSIESRSEGEKRNSLNRRSVFQLLCDPKV